jgi:hypothetical protein
MTDEEEISKVLEFFTTLKDSEEYGISSIALEGQVINLGFASQEKMDGFDSGIIKMDKLEFIHTKHLEIPGPIPDTQIFIPKEALQEVLDTLSSKGWKVDKDANSDIFYFDLQTFKDLKK